MSVLYVQRRAHKAGAQASLMRLLRSHPLRTLDPVLVTSEEGWLTRACEQASVPYLFRRFPSSRSLRGRFWANRAFAVQVDKDLRELGISSPVIVHGNDHQENLLTLSLSDRLETAPVVTLRSSGMSSRDFRKYRCHENAAVVAVSEALASVARASGGRHVTVAPNGLSSEEFHEPIVMPKVPKQVLVIGTSAPSKGFPDVIAALRLLADFPEVRDMTFDFTADSLPAGAMNFDDGPVVRCIGREDDFVCLLRRYDMVIHPSRRESFGMAPLEAVAAGVPVLASRAGAIATVLHTQHQFEAANLEQLTAVLHRMIVDGAYLEYPLGAYQHCISERFSIDKTVQANLRVYSQVRAPVAIVSSHNRS